MSDVFATVTEGLEQGLAQHEIAYALTCEYPSMTMALALELIEGVMKFEQEYLGELQ
jgi:hypothetical protein